MGSVRESLAKREESVIVRYSGYCCTKPSNFARAHMSKCILIVDDEPSIREMLSRALDRLGYETVEAENGEVAIRMLAERSVDLVITDVLMPERDGLETLLAIRKQLADTPVIVMSAPSNQLYLEDARGLGAAAAFEKPLKLGALCDKVVELIGEGRAE